MEESTLIRKICLFAEPIPRPGRAHNDRIRDVWVFGICIHRWGESLAAPFDVNSY